MKFASIRDFRTSVSSILHKTGKDDTVIVTLRGKPVALFVPVDESQLEDMTQAIKLARLRTSVEKVRTQAQKTGLDRMSAKAIEREIKTARGARHA